jgi:tRNA/rRNA methyltransferase
MNSSRHWPASLPSGPGAAAANDWAHVVLVEPGDPLNIGAVARAMSNLGFHNLRLVAPPNFDREKAATSACWATPMLERVPVYPALEEAVADLDQVVGFSARHGHDRPRHLMLDEWCDLLAEEPPGRVGLLFGPEDHGLETRHLAPCRWLIRIPSSEENPSFNLAQSVLLALYELSRPRWRGIAPESKPRPGAAAFAALDRLVETVLTQCGYFRDGTPLPVPRIVKNLLRRTDPDQREMNILTGMFGKIHRALAGQVPARPVEEVKEGSGTESEEAEAPRT